MSTYTDITCHLVFATKNRVCALDKSRREDLFRFMWGLLKERNCHLYRIGGIEDHIHILTSLHPTLALASLVKEIKTASSAWIKGGNVFPLFGHWQEGYGAFSVSAKDRPGLIHSIKEQEIHHQKPSFVDELQHMIENAHLEWKPDHLP
jgi:putative transposase